MSSSFSDNTPFTSGIESRPNSSAFGISILVPCFQEEQNVADLIKRAVSVMENTNLGWEIVLVDDGSTDNTWKIIEAVSKEDSRIKGVRHLSNEGMVSAWQTALNHASGDWVVTIDADLQFAPEEIPRLVNEMQNGDFDLVQAIRENHLESKYRVFLSVVFSRMLKLFFSVPFEDVKSGFVLYKRTVFEQILSLRHRFRLYQHLTILAAYWLGLKISQVPTTVHPRKAGKSFITSPLAYSCVALFEMPAAILQFRVRKSRAGTQQEIP
jgi:glycosyltransferase involved in cell wall biosynthesis